MSLVDEARAILKLSEAEERTVRRLRADGKTARAIATEAKLPFQTVKQFMLDNPPAPPKVVKPKGKRVAPDYGSAAGGLFQVYAWDLETTNLRADIGTLLVAAFYDLRSLVEWVLERMEEADVLIGQNSKAFDRNFVSGVCGRLGLRQPPKRVHLDTMHMAQHGLKGLLQSVSMKNLVDYFRLPVAKDQPSKHDWRGANLLTEDEVDRITVRCVEDVKVQALLWDRLRPYFHEWKGER